MKTGKIKKLVVFSGLLVIDVLVGSYFRQRGVGTENGGVAFGFSFFGVVGLAMVLWIVLSVYLFRKTRVGGGWWLIWAGGGANLVSRLFFGEVWDYLSIIPNLWFNGADIMIALGTLERLLEILGKKEK